MGGGAPETTAYNIRLKPTQCIRYLGAAPLSKFVAPNIFGTFYEKITLVDFFQVFKL